MSMEPYEDDMENAAIDFAIADSELDMAEEEDLLDVEDVLISARRKNLAHREITKSSSDI